MSDPYAKIKLPTKEVTMKSVSDLGSELVNLFTEKDNILYPSLDNRANAYISVYAILSVYIDYELTKDEVIKKLSDKIAEVKKEIEVL
jgi:tetrahydromethanopterin S-methyltransferase subunit H